MHQFRINYSDELVTLDTRIIVYLWNPSDYFDCDCKIVPKYFANTLISIGAADAVRLSETNRKRRSWSWTLLNILNLTMPDRQQNCYWVDLSNGPDNESNQFNCLLQSLDYQILQSENRQSCNSVDLFD